MDDEKITLDMKSFKALASESRVTILKSLNKRRKMLTELSKELDMSPSTVKEHMVNLSKAGLVVQIDDGHKWKYYELTRAGKDILSPDETRVWVILGLSAVALIFTSWDLIRSSLFGDWGIRGAAKTFASDMIQACYSNTIQSYNSDWSFCLNFRYFPWLHDCQKKMVTANVGLKTHRFVLFLG